MINKIINILKRIFNIGYNKINDLIDLCSSEDNSVKNKVENIIKTNKDKIFNDLNNYKINNKIFDLEYFSIYKDFIEIDENKNFYTTIYNIICCINHPYRIYNNTEINNYSLEHFLLLLFQIDQVAFESWFNNSKQNELKTVFIYSCFKLWNFKYIIDINNIVKSSIKFIQIINILSYFNFNDNPITGLYKEQQKELKYILHYKDSIISSKEKLYYLLKYVNNNFRMYKYNKEDFEKMEELDKFLEDFKDLITDTLETDILNNIKFFSNSALSIIISKIKDTNKREKIYKFFIEEILERKFEDKKENINSYNTIGVNGILDSNVYDIIFQNTKTNTFIENIEKKFNELEKETSLPYFFHTNHNKWTFNISKMLYYLIAIFIYYNDKDKKKIKEYKENFENTKKNFCHFLDSNINCNKNVVNEILNYINQ